MSTHQFKQTYSLFKIAEDLCSRKKIFPQNCTAPQKNWTQGAYRRRLVGTTSKQRLFLRIIRVCCFTSWLKEQSSRTFPVNEFVRGASDTRGTSHHELDEDNLRSTPTTASGDLLFECLHAACPTTKQTLKVHNSKVASPLCTTIYPSHRSRIRSAVAIAEKSFAARIVASSCE